MCIENLGHENNNGSVPMNSMKNWLSSDYVGVAHGCDDALVLECFEACAMASRLQDGDSALETADAIAVRQSWQRLLFSIATAKAKNVSGLMAKRSVLRACMDIEGGGPDWLNLLITGLCNDMDLMFRKGEWSRRGGQWGSFRYGRRGWRLFGREFLIEWAPAVRR